ncbi:RecQ family ATP-dependent DNA helicase [Paludicola sp. MB14-C6]|uniref:RecQ family ATP-dependent DNA helicase n=1 Tax=Paludihabitans sp. MB14-C6 TaxID=3070656 RepID=UPI0027DC5577|nr:RecQ family ATP-dependent DNA helicase [Paludicola sp. MB14-C6]WMJ22923.1 RecQ family ATP-dependent DNA helicase [Paludicola sp. MB14-C6]
MLKFSASYGKSKSNFVIQNLDYPIVQDNYYGVYCVLKNILQRGSVTKPSQYLKSNLTLSESLYNKDCPAIYFISEENSKWNNVVKGDGERNYNPALYFLETIIPNYFKEYAFVQNLILPEALVTDIIPENSESFIGQQVDFYIAQAKLVIEIDGYQHNESIQKRRDNERDVFLIKNGIKIVRIPTKAIRIIDDNLQSHIKDIISALRSSVEISAYKEAYEDSNYYKQNKARIQYDMIMRFQLMLIQLLQTGKLDLSQKNWEFTFTKINKIVSKMFYLAFNDLMIWLEHLCALRKLNFKKPEILITMQTDINSKNSVNIDFSIYKRWTDENKLKPNTIYIRNDYFDEKDYYIVSTHESIKYDLIMEGVNSDKPHLDFILQNIFGYNEFNDGQEAIIVNALRKNDTIGILPTGSGKSLCYQFVSLLQPCISFAVCPILSLIYDQKDNLDDVHIDRTSYISSDLDAKQKDQIMMNYAQGKYQIIWISPERFQVQKFRDSLREINYSKNFGYAVIDEVHCMSEWGHDFRTSYLNLVKTIKEYCPATILLGLTATASQFVLKDIKNEFQIDSENVKSTSTMDRKELYFEIVNLHGNDKYDSLLNQLSLINTMHSNKVFELADKNTKCGLIFTVNKGGQNGCIEISQKLSKDLNVNVQAYHSDLKYEKKVIQEGYRENIFPLLVATKAFGMGVNKPNIRYTIHYGLPWSVEAFYQEAGRAGRDRKSAKCFILYQPEICHKDILNELFSKNIKISRLVELTKYLKCDLSNIMYLWKLNNLGVERDLSVMRWIFNYLKSQDSDIVICNPNYNKSEVEKAIYKLSLLGIIGDWTIEEWGEKNAKIRVKRVKYSEKSVKNKLKEYINRYDSNFSETNTSGHYNDYLQILNDTTLPQYDKYMKLLLQWGYDEIVYSRRQSIKTMMDLCDAYTNSEDLKQFINYYFKFDDKAILLDQITYNPNDYNLWFDLFYKTKEAHNISQAKHLETMADIEKLLPTMQRYLESYRYNTGLNYVSGMLRLICDKFNDTDGFSRFSDAFNEIESYDEDSFNDIFEKTLTIGSIASDKNKDVLGEFLSNRYPDKAIQVYTSLNDNGSLLVELNNTLDRIQNLKESL